MGNAWMLKQEVDKLSALIFTVGISQMPLNMLDREYSRWRINGAECGQRWKR